MENIHPNEVRRTPQGEDTLRDRESISPKSLHSEELNFLREHGIDPEKEPHLTLAFAKAYLKAGYSIIPLHSPKTHAPKQGSPGEGESSGKIPIGSWANYKSQRMREEDAIRTFSRTVLNLGIVMGTISGNVFALDFDHEEAYADWKAHHLAYATTATQKTSKGYHLLFRVKDPSILPQKNTKFLYNDIPVGDIKTNGGYLVVSPSIHVSGHRYMWTQSPGFIREVLSFEELGVTVLHQMMDSPTTEPENETHGITPLDSAPVTTQREAAYRRDHALKVMHTVIGKLIQAKEGDRNNSLNRAAFHLGRFIPMGYLTEEEVRYQLTGIANHLKLQSHETASTIQSGLAAGKAKPIDLSDKRPPGRPEKRVDSTPIYVAIKEELSRRFDFRFNQVLDRIEFKHKSEEEYRLLTDFDVNSILVVLALGNARLKTLPKERLQHVLESDFVPPYHPFKAFYSNLPLWDGQENIERLCSKIVTVKGQEERLRLYLRRWLIAYVACTHGVSPNHGCLVLVGPQGIGKTTFLKKVTTLVDAYTYIGALNASDKDSKMLVHSMSSIILDELEGSTKSDMSYLKSLITVPHETYRRPYGRYTETHVRHASFSASVNDVQIIHDLTGSRRWLILEVVKIDFQSITFMDQVWAEAFHHFQSGEKYWFDKDEIAMIDCNNSAYHIVAPELELLAEHFSPVPWALADEYLSTTQILHEIQKTKDGNSLRVSSIMVSAKRLGSILRIHGFERRKKDGIYKFAVKREAFADALPIKGRLGSNE